MARRVRRTEPDAGDDAPKKKVSKRSAAPAEEPKADASAEEPKADAPAEKPKVDAPAEKVAASVPATKPKVESVPKPAAREGHPEGAPPPEEVLTYHQTSTHHCYKLKSHRKISIPK